MTVQFIESLEGRRFLSGSPAGAFGLNAPTPGANGVGLQQHDRDRLRDGSCQTVAAAKAGASQLPAVQDRIRARLNDGSCGG